jgi:hypothetical protein
VPEKLIGAALTGAQYQWEYSINGNEWTDIVVNGTFAEYLPDALTQTTYYRRKTIVGVSSAYSNVVGITVLESNVAPEISNLKPAYCRGDEVTLTVRNTAGYTYHWYDKNDREISEGTSFRINQLKSDTIVKIMSFYSANGCLSVPVTYTINVDQVQADFSSQNTQVALGAGIRFTNLSQHAKQYEWDFGEAEGSFARELVYYFNIPGEKTIKLSAESEYGCKSEKIRENYIRVLSDGSSAAYPEVPGEPGLTGVEDKDRSEVLLYPNPCSDQIYLKFGRVITGSIKIFSNTGQLMYSTKINTELETIDVSRYPSGGYIIQVSENKTFSTYKFIKQ